jgi:cell division protein FtsL
MACLVMMFVFICELLFYTWCRVQSTHIRFDIARQADKANELSAMQDNLKIELARLKSPRRIAKIAREQLGLITPTPQQTIVLP